MDVREILVCLQAGHSGRPVSAKLVCAKPAAAKSKLSTKASIKRTGLSAAIYSSPLRLQTAFHQIVAWRGTS